MPKELWVELWKAVNSPVEPNRPYDPETKTLDPLFIIVMSYLTINALSDYGIAEALFTIFGGILILLIGSFKIKFPQKSLDYYFYHTDKIPEPASYKLSDTDWRFMRF